MKTAIIIFLCMLIIAAIAAHSWHIIEAEIHRQETDLPALKFTKFYKKSAKDERARKWQRGGIVSYDSGCSEMILTPEQQERLKNIVACHEMPKDAPKITQDDIMKAMTYKSN